MKRSIYADHAATTPLSSAAWSAMEPYLTKNFYNPSAKYTAARNAHKVVEAARQTIAQCIGAEPSEIYFTSGGTESDNWAIKGTMLQRGDHRCVITDAMEHHAILNACAFVERMGFPAVYMNPDKDGLIQPATLESSITPSAKLVSVMMMNNELGTIQPILTLANIAHSHGALFHTDAVQAVGHIPVNVRELDVDMLSASAHKFGGPKGAGFLYIRSGVQLHSLLSGGGQEMGQRAGTENIAGIVGMAAALADSCAHLEDTYLHLTQLREKLICSLNTTPLTFRINGVQQAYPGTISLSIKDSDGEVLLHRLDLMGIQVATGSACDSRETQISHVLTAIRLAEDYALGTIRISLGCENTQADIEAISSAIVKICRQNRWMTFKNVSM